MTLTQKQKLGWKTAKGGFANEHDILKGRGMLSAEWFLVTRLNTDGTTNWVLKNINQVINFYAQGDVRMSDRGSLILGRLTAQRKGGTPDPTSLQFKIKPNDLFKLTT